MTAARRLVLFLVVMLPIMAVLFAGLVRVWRFGGQADPWTWALPAALILALLGQLLAKQRWPLIVWVATGTTGTILIFCYIAAVRPPDPIAAVGLLLATILAGLGSMILHMRQTRLMGLGMLAIAAMLIWRCPTPPITASPDRPILAVITALPLFWDEMGQAGRADAPIITLLRKRFTVLPLDDPRALERSGARRLLLAQPRALSPDQLVAIDRWVRAGGTALVLADPLLRWPSALPLGDRRRAPSVHLLDPLLERWDFRPGQIEDQEIRSFASDKTLVTLSGVQKFLMDQGGRGDEIIHRKRIGQGEVLLLGDADLLDDRLWLANPEKPLDPRLWSADTPARLVHWLGGAVIDGRRWMRNGADVTLALRWALLIGTGWAIMGVLLLERISKLIHYGTNHENWLESHKEIR